MVQPRFNTQWGRVFRIRGTLNPVAAASLLLPEIATVRPFNHGDY